MSVFSDTVLEADVVARARAGDETAHEQIYRAYQQPVRTLARRLLSHGATAEDIAQDVFVDVLTRLHQYEGRGSFAGWVRSITVSRCLMHLRSPWQRSRRWLASASGHGVDDDTFGLRDESEDGRADPSAALDLVRALATLGGTSRAVVWLHDVEGYTHGEIGALFGATASFSKSQLARAHDRLREALQAEGVGNPCIPAPSTY